MGSGEKRHHHRLNFHVHHHHHQNGRENKDEFIRDIPRGCVTVLVGQGEEQQKFVIPVMHINHPLFTKLLKEAEKEYGFHHNGPVNIPCHVEEFRYVEGIIDKENATHLHHHHHHHHLCTCFKA